jgi:hypothetical protein
LDGTFFGIQVVPLHVSASAVVAPDVTRYPTVSQEVVDAEDTPFKDADVAPFGLACALMTHPVPFQASTSKVLVEELS